MMMSTLKAAMGGGEAMVDASSMMENKELISFMAGFTVKRLMSMMGTMGAEPLTKEQMLGFNAALNQIKK